MTSTTAAHHQHQQHYESETAAAAHEREREQRQQGVRARLVAEDQTARPLTTTSPPARQPDARP